MRGMPSLQETLASIKLHSCTFVSGRITETANADECYEPLSRIVLAVPTSADSAAKIREGRSRNCTFHLHFSQKNQLQRDSELAFAARSNFGYCFFFLSIPLFYSIFFSY